MLTNTFLHVPGITEAIEFELWRQGSLSWHDYLGSSTRWKCAVDATRVIKNSLARLERRDYAYFVRKLPSREHWRAFPEFSDRIAYLDIETDGGFSAESITMIGASDGDRFHAYIKGRDLDKFPYYLVDKGLIVTFFGSGFDLPMLRKLFPYLPFDQLHIDLCHALRRLGYRGGLKNIERQLGLSRSADTDGLTGRDAITLWRQYRKGHAKALDLLIEYNREDVMNLKTLLALAYQGLRKDRFGAFDH